ncbi:hypothetical protein [Mycobacterium colombiense]|uniref:hypothetical protein n=1 Tax=Mycobacterium colombiense TaxID=339268 RepID=UPI0012DB51E2|nr:hypothetical protein [Mycobacterium colombiense]
MKPAPDFGAGRHRTAARRIFDRFKASPPHRDTDKYFLGRKKDVAFAAERPLPTSVAVDGRVRGSRRRPVHLAIPRRWLTGAAGLAPTA